MQIQSAESSRRPFERAQLPYFNPHSFRKTLVRLGQEVCKTTEDFKAWSQNLGHSEVMTTLTSYGQLDTRRQGEILRRLTEPPLDDESLKDLFRNFVAEVKKRP